MTMTYKPSGMFTSSMSMEVTTEGETRANLLRCVKAGFTGTVTFTVDGRERPDLTVEVV